LPHKNYKKKFGAHKTLTDEVGFSCFAPIFDNFEFSARRTGQIKMPSIEHLIVTDEKFDK